MTGRGLMVPYSVRKWFHPRIYHLHKDNPWCWDWHKAPSDHWVIGLGRWIFTTEPK